MFDVIMMLTRVGLVSHLINVFVIELIDERTILNNPQRGATGIFRG